MFPRMRLSGRNDQLNQLQPVQGSAQSAGIQPWNSWKAICFRIRILTHPGKARPGSHLPGNTSRPSRAVGSWGSSALGFLPHSSPLSHLPPLPPPPPPLPSSSLPPPPPPPSLFPPLLPSCPPPPFPPLLSLPFLIFISLTAPRGLCDAAS